MKIINPATRCLVVVVVSVYACVWFFGFGCGESGSSVRGETPEILPCSIGPPQPRAGKARVWTPSSEADSLESVETQSKKADARKLFEFPVASPPPPMVNIVADAMAPEPIVSEEVVMVEPWTEPRFSFLPGRLLWEPPLAALREPRMFVKRTSLSNQFTTDTIDTAIGGTIGLVRYRPGGMLWTEFQLDAFAVHFARFSERRFYVAGDYRYGFPVTFRQGNWHGKIGYEHTSTHLGDDLIARTGRRRVPYIRDEIVVALGYRWWNRLRVYGEMAYAFSYESPVRKGPERFAWGVEWSRQCPTGWKGQPFAAFHMDLRPEQNYRANTTLQLGWQWIPQQGSPSARIALEFYDGKSPFGQFLSDNESWIGLGLYLEF